MLFSYFMYDSFLNFNIWKITIGKLSDFFWIIKSSKVTQRVAKTKWFNSNECIANLYKLHLARLFSLRHKPSQKIFDFFKSESKQPKNSHLDTFTTVKTKSLMHSVDAYFLPPLLWSISPNFVCQVMISRGTVFGEKIATQLHQHSVTYNQPKTVLKFAKMWAPHVPKLFLILFARANVDEIDP